MPVNYTSFFKLILNKRSRLTLCNRCSVSIICWPTRCCMANRSFGAVTSSGPELHSSEKREPREKKLTLMWDCVRPGYLVEPARMSLACHRLPRLHKNSILFASSQLQIISIAFSSNIIYETINHHSFYSSLTETNHQCTHCFKIVSN